MSFPANGDYIDIHNHGSKPEKGIFVVESLPAHEGIIAPESGEGMVFSVGVHPWFLTESNMAAHLDFVRHCGSNESVVAIGESGFDKLKGAPMWLQIKTFEEQVKISESLKKPLIIHCVKGWDELLASYQKMKPKMAWLVHGFRGSKELAHQLISKGMYLSLWYEFEFSELLRSISCDRLFLETDGSGVDIRVIYKKAADNLDLSIDELKEKIAANYRRMFLTDI
jgi:TatD DNase family protein